jgi:hypothetical protein
MVLVKKMHGILIAQPSRQMVVKVSFSLSNSSRQREPFFGDFLYSQLPKGKMAEFYVLYYHIILIDGFLVVATTKL